MSKKNKKIIFYILILFSSFCAISIGYSWDEGFLINQGKVTANYLLSLGLSDPDNFFRREFYSPIYYSLRYLFVQAFPVAYQIEAGHLVNLFFSFATIIGIKKICEDFFNKEVSLIVFLILFFFPAFFGHMGFNSKDTIIAFCHVWIFYLAIKYLKSHQSSKIYYISVLSAVGTGINLFFLGSLLPLIVFFLLEKFVYKKFNYKELNIKKFIGEFAECLEGIKEACEFLNYPVVSGNVSFYNGTNKKNIFPTPVIGGVGIINKLSSPINHKLKKDKSLLLLIGKTFGHIEQSCFLKENFSIIEGSPPEINFFNEKNNGEAVLNLITQGLANSVHDVSNGGLIVALCEMAMSSNYGIKIEKPKKIRNPIEYFFGEDQGRYIVEINKDNLIKVEKVLQKNDIYYELLGITQKKYLEIEGLMKSNINDLFKINSQWYNQY